MVGNRTVGPQLILVYHWTLTTFFTTDINLCYNVECYLFYLGVPFLKETHFTKLFYRGSIFREFSSEKKNLFSTFLTRRNTENVTLKYHHP